MAISLYDSLIPSFQQIVGSVAGLIDKAEAHCAEQNIAPEEIIQGRLVKDMLPFTYQVKAVAEHSAGAIEAIREGVFTPSLGTLPDSFSGLKALMSKTQETLAALDPAEINAFEGRDMRFQFNDYGIDFTAQGFLWSFSQPNFYFHATTAYDILRVKGVKLGKMVFLGTMQLKG
jgi:uncharacterized protein